MRIFEKVLALFFLLQLFYANTAFSTPAAPEFLPGQPMIVNKQVLVMWMPVPGAVSYNLYVDDKKMFTAPANQFLAPLPEAVGEHKYQVSAVDAAGLEGPKSQPGFIKIRTLVSPKNLIAKPDAVSKSIGLIWDRAEGAVMYNIFRSEADKKPILIGSVRGERFKDGNISESIAYTYTVTAKDQSGAESPPSEPVTTKLEPNSEKKSVNAIFRAAPTTEEFSIADINGVVLDNVSYLGKGPNDNIWVVTPRSKQIHILKDDGSLISSIGPITIEETGLSIIPQKLDFGPKKLVYITDAVNSMLTAIDPTAGSIVWSVNILTPPPDLEEVWDALPERLQALPPTPSAVLCMENEIWVSDQRFQLIYRFAYADGELLGYLTSVNKDKDDEYHLPSVGEMLKVDDEKIMFTFPLLHSAVIVDLNLNVTTEFATVKNQYYGALVGIHGAYAHKKEEILLTDPTVGTIIAYSVQNGEYLYYLSGEEPQEDPNYKGRADFKIQKPNLTIIDSKDRYWIFDAAVNRIYVLKQSGEVTPPLVNP